MVTNSLKHSAQTLRVGNKQVADEAPSKQAHSCEIKATDSFGLGLDNSGKEKRTHIQASYKRARDKLKIRPSENFLCNLKEKQMTNLRDVWSEIDKQRGRHGIAPACSRGERHFDRRTVSGGVTNDNKMSNRKRLMPSATTGASFALLHN